ncbi:MAG: hypothetical protein ACOVK2_02930 [Candidatus Fonsibacter sp.]
MELKVKEEYLEYSIGGGKMKSTKLKNILPEQYEYFYNNGFEEFFNVIVEDVIEEIIITEDIIEDDFFTEEDEDITE